MSSFRKDIEHFEYRKKYLKDKGIWVMDFYAPEHRWCPLYTFENTKKFHKEREKQAMSRYKRNRVQSDPEITGQKGTMIN